MAIIYSYPIATPTDSDLLIISRVPTDPDEISNFSVTTDALASFVTARVNLTFVAELGGGVVNLDTQVLTVNGTANEIETSGSGQALTIGLPDNVTIANNLSVGGNMRISTLTSGFIPVTKDQGTLLDSVIYQETSGNPNTNKAVALNTLETGTAYAGTYPDLRVASRQDNDFAILDLFRRDNNVLAGETAAMLQYSVQDDGRYAIAQISAETLTTSGTGNSGGGKFVFKTSQGGGSGPTYNTPESRFTLDKDSADFSVPVNVTGGLDVAGTVRLGFTGNDPVILGNPTGKRTEWNNPGYFEIYAENPDSPGDFNETVDIDGEFLGGGYIGVYPVRTENRHGVRMHSRDGGGIEANFIDIASVESSAVYDEDQIRLITAVDGFGTYAGIKISHPTDNRFRFNSEFNTEPTVPFLVNSSSKFTGQLTIPATPVASTDAASKGYVDAQNTGQVSGTGTTNTLPIWSDGTNGILGDSPISTIYDIGNNTKEIDIVTTSGLAAKWKFNGAGNKFTMYQDISDPSFLLTGDNTGFYKRNFQIRGTLAVGRSNQATAATLDVGNSSDTRPAAFFRNGVVVSNNPSGVQVDNTSMVIGAGNNDNVSGSDHCLIVGSGNQITDNSDQSVAFGQGNAITSSVDATAAGNQNIITTSARSLALGSQNQITNATSSFAAGGENVIPSGTTNMLLGYQNAAGSGSGNYILGNVITGTSQAMTLGFRNDTAGYPTANKNLGLGDTKFVVAVGSNTTTNANALIITEGGVNGGSSGTVPQVPRVILPTIVNFNFADDTAAAAGGIPIGGLYHNAGVIRIRLT